MGDFNTSLDRSVRQKNEQRNKGNNRHYDSNGLNILEYSIQTEKNIPSSQHLMEHSQKRTTYSEKKQTSTNKKKTEISNNHGLKLEFNSNTNYRKPTNTWKKCSSESSIGKGRNKERN